MGGWVGEALMVRSKTYKKNSPAASCPSKIQENSWGGLDGKRAWRTAGLRVVEGSKHHFRDDWHVAVKKNMC